MKLSHKNYHSILKRCRLCNILFISLSLSACEEFISVDPPKTQITTVTVFNDDASAVSAMSGIYHEMYQSEGMFSGNTRSITVLAGCSADEFTNYSTNQDLIQLAENEILDTNVIIKGNLWEEGYKVIYYANSLLAGLATSSNLTASLKIQLEGEAKFIRAFCHFYLLNVFGDIPYASTVDYRVNSRASRIPALQVYDLIISDLKDAQALLSENYSMANNERVRANKWAATALLARTYLFIKDWENAENQATALINYSTLYSLETNINNVFLKNSSEAIWQIKPILEGRNTTEANIFILQSTPNNVALSESLLNAFEPGDQRRLDWVGSIDINSETFFYPYKYKQGSDANSLTEYSMMLRLGEQYLIRAEARVKQGDIDGAKSDINAIRNRANLSNTNAIDEEAILLAIEKERQIELFSELGHRWFDLKRTDRADEIMHSAKGSSWQSYDVLYPIPRSEIQTNSNLAPQNQGY